MAALGTPRPAEGEDPPLVASHSENNTKVTQVKLDPGAVKPLPDNALASRQSLFDNIFSACPADVAKQASRAERQSDNMLSDLQSLTYGEVDLRSMHDILNLVKRELGNLHAQTGIFLDLGSGAGKAVIGAGLLHPFAQVMGVERLQCLSDFANTATERYREVTIPDGASKPEVQFLRGDFVELMEGQELQELAPQVAICLAVSTCYSDDQMQAIARFAKIMAPGSFIITFTQMLPESFIKSEAWGWELVHTMLMQMMWGQSTCFIYRKVPVTEAAGPGV
jgi:hypothetical protein